MYEKMNPTIKKNSWGCVSATLEGERKAQVVAPMTKSERGISWQKAGTIWMSFIFMTFITLMARIVSGRRCEERSPTFQPLYQWFPRE